MTAEAAVGLLASLLTTCAEQQHKVAERLQLYFFINFGKQRAHLSREVVLYTPQMDKIINKSSNHKISHYLKRYGNSSDVFDYVSQ